MEELRLAFLVIGAIAIIGILIHGMWSVRRNSQEKGRASLETQDWNEYEDEVDDLDVESDTDSDVILLDPHRKSSNKVEPSLGNDNFDELGIGTVRVMSQAPKQPSVSNSDDTSEQAQDGEDDVAQTDLSTDTDDVVKPEIKESEAASKPKIYSSVVTQPKPEYAAQQVQAMRSRMSAIDGDNPNDIPEPPPFLLKPSGIDSLESTKAADSDSDISVTTNDKEPAPATHQSNTSKKTSEQRAEVKTETVAETDSDQPLANKVSIADQARNFVKRSKSEPKSRKRREPQIREDQMKIDFDEPEEELKAEVTSSTKSSADTTSQPPEQEVLVLNVRATDDNPIQGAALLPMLLTLGFKFGEQDIFHRHVNSNGKGPVLFSLANMFKPGVFDIDNLENFTTLGVTLFMMLPIDGDPHQVFNMMHNAARKIADEFSAQVLDGRRSALTKQSLQQYVEKIREFERKRMIAR